MQFILKMTTACNLNCVYCSEGDKPAETMPAEIFCKLVDELPPLLDRVKDTKAEFLFHGGEPMLYGRENLQRLIDYARKNLEGYSVKFLMQTNGTLIDDAWIEFFRANEIGVGVSLDGYPELHDKNRRTKTGAPTAEKILGNLKKMRDAGLSTGTLMVLNSAKTLDADKLFDFISANNLHPKIHPVIACGRAAGRTDSDDVYDAWAELMKKFLARMADDENLQIISPLDDMYHSILSGFAMGECSFNGSCGVSFIGVYPDGDVGFCGHDNSTRLFVYGNLRDKSLTELYYSANAEKIRARQEYLKAHDCKNCADWELCRGGCSFEAVNAFGTLNAKYPNCDSRRKFIAWLKTDGLKFVKAALIREKVQRQKMIQTKKKILDEIDDLEIDIADGA